MILKDTPHTKTLTVAIRLEMLALALSEVAFRDFSNQFVMSGRSGDLDFAG